MRIGVAGLNGSGKSAAVEFFRRRSFHAVSLSDLIRQDLAKDRLEPTRENMIERGRALRSAGGAGVLAQRLLPSLPEDRHCVIDSIRHPAEVEVLRAAGSFALLWIDAPAELRFARARERARPGDATDFAHFQELESRELAPNDASGQQLLAVRELAEEVVANTGTLQELEAELLRLLQGRLPFRDRPSWDDYFMSIARVVSSRSNCVKRKVAAVVTLDRRIISTGYNGTPRGTRNCNEGGCPRCNSFAQGGTRLEECLCSHGEENAITQAAYHGVSLRGATIYTTFAPCLQCTKMIINAGLSEVVYSTEYPLGETSLDLLREAGVKLRQVSSAS
jgi:dCMP deaminase